MEYTFDKEDTAICKGIAVLLMVWHYMFYQNPTIPLVAGKLTGVPYHIGVFGKICVTIFMILSGYGIAKKTQNKEISFREFQRSITAKLYKNYLFIVIIIIAIFATVPRLRDSLIGTGITAIYRIALSLSGMEYWFLNMGINIVWWYISMILSCYLLYAIVQKFIRKLSVWLVFICLICITFSLVDIPRFGFFQIVSWELCFSSVL